VFSGFQKGIDRHVEGSLKERGVLILKILCFFKFSTCHLPNLCGALTITNLENIKEKLY
jgi:hypothetical protein